MIDTTFCGDSEAGIRSIVGRFLSGVSFVQDYVEFHFDEKVVRSLTDPFVVTGGKAVEFPHAGSRDCLCLLIGRKAQDLLLDDEKSIEIIFDDQTKLVVPLSESRRTGPEAAHYISGADRPMEIW